MNSNYKIKFYLGKKNICEEREIDNLLGFGVNLEFDSPRELNYNYLANMA